MGKFYVARNVEVCSKDEDGDDIVHAVCGAGSLRSGEYYTQTYQDRCAMAERIVAALNAQQDNEHFSQHSSESKKL